MEVPIASEPAINSSAIALPRPTRAGCSPRVPVIVALCAGDTATCHGLVLPPRRVPPPSFGRACACARARAREGSNRRHCYHPGTLAGNRPLLTVAVTSPARRVASSENPCARGRGWGIDRHLRRHCDEQYPVVYLTIKRNAFVSCEASLVRTRARSQKDRHQTPSNARCAASAPERVRGREAGAPGVPRAGGRLTCQLASASHAPRVRGASRPQGDRARGGRRGRQRTRSSSGTTNCAQGAPPPRRAQRRAECATPPTPTCVARTWYGHVTA